MRNNKNLSAQEKRVIAESRAAEFSCVSIIINLVLAVGKFIIAFSRGVFFFVSGCINVLWLICKIECYVGLKKIDKDSFKFRNNLISFYLLFAGIEYTIYMLSLVFGNRSVMQYDMVPALGIATMSFVELGVAIYGICTTKGKGHYYRDLKIINFCTALTSIIWTELALLSFTKSESVSLACGWSGAAVGFVIILFAVYIFFAPKISLIDREHNVYKLIDGKENLLGKNDGEELEIMLVKSWLYGSYVYKATYNAGGVIDGHIVKTKSGLNELNIFAKILIGILSEILIFVYAIGAAIYFFKTIDVLRKLDNHMNELNFENNSLKNCVI